MFLLNDSTHRMLMRFDDKIGHRYVPNTVARVPHETGGYLVRTNSAGFRSDLEFNEARGSLPRILVFGDSFTAGEGCASEQRYPELLGQELGVEVYNYGLSGSAPDQHLLCYREFAKYVQADLIVWGIPLHNIERIKLTHRPSRDRVSGKPILVPKPYFTLEQGCLELHHVPVPRLRPEPSQSNRQQYTESGSWQPPVMERLLKLPVFEAFRDTAQHVLPGLKEHIRAWAYRLSNTQLYEDYLDSQSAGWTLLSALIQQLRVEVQDIPILVVPLPTYHYYIDRIPPVYDGLYRTLEDPINKLFVSTITKSLHEGKTLEERKALCFPTDTHYSPLGHQAIARLLAAEIRQKQLLPDRPDSAFRVKSSLGTEGRIGKFVLGLAFGQGNAAAALVRDGKVIALAEEGSFTRGLRRDGFPQLAVNYCLEEARISQSELEAVIYGCELSSDLKSDVQSLFATANRTAWLDKLSGWVMRNLNVYHEIRSRLRYEGPLLESSSCASQCASAFYSSPFANAAILHLGDVHRLNRTTIAQGSERGLELLKEYCVAHKLQTFKAVMTKFISGIAKLKDFPLWRLAQGGEPVFVHDIFNCLVELKENGSIELNADYFSSDSNDLSTALALDQLFDTTKSESKSIGTFHANLARSTQFVICSVIVQVADYARELTGQANLCVSGAFANDPDVQDALVKAGIFDNIWFQPLVGNADSALGAALIASFEYFDTSRSTSQVENVSRMFGLYGPEYSAQEIDAFVDTFDYPSKKYGVEEQTVQIASMLTEGRIVGHFAGRLGVSSDWVGDRLILSRLETSRDSRTSLDHRHGTEFNFERTIAIADLSPFSNAVQCWGKSTIPLDRSACEMAPGEVDSVGIHQTKADTNSEEDTDWVRLIHQAVSPRTYNIINRFERLTGCSAIAIAPFAQPASGTVCTPLDAYRVFMESNMDVLVLGEHILLKSDQPPWPDEPLIRPDNETSTIGVAREKLIQVLDQQFNRRWMPTLLEVHVTSASYASRTFESGASALVSEVPPELERNSRNRVGRKMLAELLERGYEGGPGRDVYRELVSEVVRLNKLFYKNGNGTKSQAAR